MLTSLICIFASRKRISLLTHRGTRASNPTYGKWFKFNDTSVELVEDFESNMEQLEFECFGGNFNETQFPNSERARREHEGSSSTSSNNAKDKASALPPVPALDDHLFGDERTLDMSADLENLMLRRRFPLHSFLYPYALE